MRKHLTSPRTTLGHKSVHKKGALTRYDDGGVMPRYIVEDVPDIFCQIGSLGGKLKEVWWSSTEDAHSAHTYILLNCEEMQLFER